MVASASAAALEVLGLLRLEDDRTWAAAATSWQRADAAGVLDVTGPRLHYWTRPRGGAKTSDLAGVVIAWLLEQARPGERGYVVAADGDQAGELVVAADGYALRTPELAGRIRVLSDRVTNATSGAAVLVMTADGASAFGKRPALTIIDEASQWPDTPTARKVWTAVATAFVKGKGRGRLVVATTAGDPSSRAFALLERARAAPDRWRVSEIGGPLPWQTEEDLTSTRELVWDMPWEIERLIYNQWTAADDKLVDLGELRACVGHDVPLGWRSGAGPYVVGVDLAVRRDQSVVTVANVEQREGRQVVVVDEQRVWVPTRAREVMLDEVEAHCRDVDARFQHPLFVFDPAKGEQMMQHLRADGLRVEEFTFTERSVGQLGSLLFSLISQRLIDLPADEGLLDELAHVKLVERLSGMRLDHAYGRHDDRAVSIALAARRLLDAPRSGPGIVVAAAGLEFTGDLLGAGF